MSDLLTSLQENKTAAKQKHTMSDPDDLIMERERRDLVSPHWRRFFNEHCWPAWRLDRCSLDELLRLQRAVPYLQTAIDHAVRRKELAR